MLPPKWGPANLPASLRVHQRRNMLHLAAETSAELPAMTGYTRPNHAAPVTRRVRVRAPDHPAVVRARAYLDASAGPVSLDVLAGAVRLSKSHLARLFRNQVGLPPHAYSVRLRIAKACRLLADGVPIAEAAQAAGFADQSHLTRHFKGRLGLTPGAYVRTLLHASAPGHIAGSKNVQDLAFRLAGS
jgi:AraC-like DNA-binding protein